jgi:pSer/pThr/pTyr-binding forkhead associated (FHA) protein
VIHSLVGDRITVGRRAENTIQIMDPSISGYHAELLLEGDHYRLHDLGSTNLTFVEGQPVTDFHLHNACKLSFGTVPCAYELGVAAEAARGPNLTSLQLEKDVAFLRTDNQDLLQKISQLQRQIDILSSARLVTGKENGTSGEAHGLDLKRLKEERDAALYQNSGLKLELEKLREELDVTTRERDSARRAHELLKGERAGRSPEGSNEQSSQGDDDKQTTQRIIFPAPEAARE